MESSGLWHPYCLCGYAKAIFYGCSQNCEQQLLASSCLSVHPSVIMGQFGSHWTDFYVIWYLRIFLKFVEKIQVRLKSDNYEGYFTWRLIVIYDVWLNYSQNEKCFRKNVVEKINTNILYSKNSFRKSRPLRDNVEKYGRDRRAIGKNIIGLVRFECRTTKAKIDTL